MRSVVLIAMLALCSTVVAFRNPFLKSSVARAQLMQSFSSVADNVKSSIKGNDVMVFSKTYCPYCTKAKQALSELGVTFNVIELDVAKDGAEMQAALLEMTGQKTVPNIFVRGTHLGGCDKTLEAIKTGTFQKMLKA